MRILFQNRRDHNLVRGGDTIQIESTKNALEKKYNIKVDISTELNPNLENYDIVHLFNITRVHETYQQLINAKKQNVLVVVTPIYHDLEAIYNYEKYGRNGIVKVLNTLINNQTHREFLKNIAKIIKQKDFKQTSSVIKQLFMGYENQQKYVIENSDFIFPLAPSEIKKMEKQLRINKELKFEITPNGIESDSLYYSKDRQIIDTIQKYNLNNIDLKKYVICVGRIEPRKNQIALIKALESTDIGVIFVGGINTKLISYYKEFIKLIDNNKYIYLGKVNHDEMMDLYNIVNTSVLPSWFEVTSLVDLEAAINGLNIVTTKYSYMYDYFGENAIYCDPKSLESIRESVKLAINKSENTNNVVISNSKLQEYTWENVADILYNSYLNILKLK